MNPETAAEPSVTTPLKPPRFRWPLRLFLCFILFDMVFRSMAALTPYLDWLDEFGMARFPKRLPTWPEIHELQEKADPDQPDVQERIGESLASLPEYFNPWPSEQIQEKLNDTADWSKYAVCWLASRLELFENLTGIDQRWTMFSPNASRGDTVARLRLLFQDGTTMDLRLLCDPPDLTNYSHWFQEKLLDCELFVAREYDARFGYCNYVSHQYPRNAKGAALDKIYVYKVWYDYPKPEEDAVEVLRSQSGPPGWDRFGPTWVFEVNSRELWKLSEEDRYEAKKALQLAPSWGEITPPYAQ